MESRGRLAKILVRLELDRMRPAPATVYAADKTVGRLTSSVAAADGQVHGLAAVKLDSARSGTELTVGGERAGARVVGYAGAPPPYILPKAGA